MFPERLPYNPLVHSYLSLLRARPEFRRLWLASVVSFAGDWFNTIASVILVTRYTESGLAVGALFLARTLPQFLLGPVAGVVADRFDRKRVMVISDLLRAGIVLSFLFVDRPERLWLLYVLTVAQFTVSAFFQPASAAILPSLVQRDELVTGNVISSITWSAMLALGSALMKTGGADYLAQVFLFSTLGMSPSLVLSFLMLLMAVLTNIVSNNAAAVIGTPIAISIAMELGLPLEPFVLAVLFGANLSFVTPMAYKTNLLVMNAGGYRFIDFVRVGTPLTLMLWLLLSLTLSFGYDLLPGIFLVKVHRIDAGQFCGTSIG